MHGATDLGKNQSVEQGTWVKRSVHEAEYSSTGICSVGCFLVGLWKVYMCQLGFSPMQCEGLQDLCYRENKLFVFSDLNHFLV